MDCEVVSAVILVPIWGVGSRASGGGNGMVATVRFVCGPALSGTLSGRSLDNVTLATTCGIAFVGQVGGRLTSEGIYRISSAWVHRGRARAAITGRILASRSFETSLLTLGREACLSTLSHMASMNPHVGPCTSGLTEIITRNSTT